MDSAGSSLNLWGEDIRSLGTSHSLSSKRRCRLHDVTSRDDAAKHRIPTAQSTEAIPCSPEIARHRGLFSWSLRTYSIERVAAAHCCHSCNGRAVTLFLSGWGPEAQSKARSRDSGRRASARHTSCTSCVSSGPPPPITITLAESPWGRGDRDRQAFGQPNRAAGWTFGRVIPTVPCINSV